MSSSVSESAVSAPASALAEDSPSVTKNMETSSESSPVASLTSASEEDNRLMMKLVCELDKFFPRGDVYVVGNRCG